MLCDLEGCLKCMKGNMKKKETFCDLDKAYIKKNIDEIISLTNNPKYVCTKCARVANEETHLCKPSKMKK